MTEREKVIKGLEYHLKELTVGKTCYECPYFGDNPCEIQLIANAIALLKEQDPRVLELDEVKAIGTQNNDQIQDENTRFIWSEEEYALHIAKPTYYDFGLEDSEEEPIYLYYIGTDFFNHFDQNTYGKTWRCWSSRPTDEQREAVPWGD